MSDVRHHLGNGFFGGWTPSRPDSRDRKFKPTVTEVPDVFELPGIANIPVLNQGSQGSCTAHGTAGVTMFDQQSQGEPIAVPSRAMIYYDARIPEGTTDQDSGAQVRDVVAGLAKYGACPESDFPYNDQVCNVAPSAADYAAGQQQAALVYEAVEFPRLDAAIASGYPIVDGMTVYSCFMTPEVAATGVVPIPSASDTTVGGHCTWRFGYNMTDEPWTSPSGLVYPPRTKAARNSWVNPDGSLWGAGGNYFLPQWYFDEGLVTDVWVVRRIGPEAS